MSIEAHSEIISKRKYPCFALSKSMLLLFFHVKAVAEKKKKIPCYLLNPLGEGNGNRRRKYPKERVVLHSRKKEEYIHRLDGLNKMYLIL